MSFVAEGVKKNQVANPATGDSRLDIRQATDGVTVVPGPNDVIVLSDDGQVSIETPVGTEISANAETPNSVEALVADGRYRVSTESFEGPFDLLLHLILREEVELYDISLSEIVDAYLSEIEQLDLCDLETATEFLLIAATLVELKVRRMMPVDEDFDLDDELGLWEERDLLLARLLECKTFKDAALSIEGMMAVSSLAVPRRAGLEDRFLEIAPDLLAGITAEKLRRAFIRVASAKPALPALSLFHVTDVKASVADALDELMAMLPALGPVTFKKLTTGIVERLEVVVRFLAVLELYKQDLVEIDQPGSIGDLTIEWTGGDGSWTSSTSDIYEG